MSSFNDQIISEFRSNSGIVGGPFEGVNMLLLTTTGRRSGDQRVSPLAYSTYDGELVVAASNGGDDRHPAWFLNLQADPHVTVELGDRTFEARAQVPDGEQRDRRWARHVEAAPGFADYEKSTDRVIPIVVLQEQSSASPAAN